MTKEIFEIKTAPVKKQNSLKDTYVFSFFYSNLTLLVGHPAERLKVAVQINLNSPQIPIMKPLLTGDISNLFRGFTTCALRQNTKVIQRTFLMSKLPHWVDGYNFNCIFSSFIKGIVASSIDTLLGAPFENVKTLQMKEVARISIPQTVKNIYRQNGCPGFFYGTTATIAKSFPSWFYLFLGYHATKDKREKLNFLSTIFWATAASLPITTFTTPFDVVKSQRQALLRPLGESNLTSAMEIAYSFGVLSLWRGFLFRLLHKSLATAAGYTIMDMTQKLDKISSGNSFRM